MFIGMNRFQIVSGREDAFVDVWRKRESLLRNVDGFLEFRLLRGPEAEDHTLFASHTIWRDREAFEAWTKSDHIRRAHANAGDNRALYMGHPRFEGFEVVLED